MTVSPTDFGGPWTRTKLEILRSYLDRYTMVLKNQSFRLIYVEAFAGSGFWKPRSAGALEDPTDFRAMWKGSAEIALEIDNKPFDRLVFIEKDNDRCSSLRRLASRHTGRRIEIVNEDANKAIPDLCRTFGDYDRAVVFLDPFAIEVSWSTVETLAYTKIVDCWILFPLGAISRMMPIKRDPDPELASHLDRFFGGRQPWQRLYKNTPQLELFGQQNQERISGGEPVMELYRERLDSVFEKVAPTPRVLCNSNKTPMFALYFAASNKRGANRAIPIANHLLTKW